MGKRQASLIVAFFVGIVCTPRVWAGGGAGPGLTITPNNQQTNFIGNGNQAAATVTITPTNLAQGQSVTVTLEVVYTPNQGNNVVTTFAIVGTTLVQPRGTSQRNNVVTSGTTWTVNINFNRNPGSGGPAAPFGSYKVDARYTVGGATVRATSVNGTVGTLAQQQNQQQAQNQQQNPPQQQTAPPPRQQNQTMFPGPQQQNAGTGSRIQMGNRGQTGGSTLILRRRYNPRRGRMEIVKHGIISQTGFLNFQNTSLQNRRKVLRNYRTR